MKYNYLQKANIYVSEISFGCMSLKASGPGNTALIRDALDNGINFFDTADLYEKGDNEIVLGKALKGHRDEVAISTKVGNRWRADGSGWDWCPNKKYIMTAIDESLKRLKTDYIDLYLLHGGTLEDPIDEVIEAFERLKELGKIKQYGLSSIRPNVIREYVKRSGIAAVMLQYSLLDKRAAEEVLVLLQQHEIGILCRGGLAGGLLAGKPPAPYLDLSLPEVEKIILDIKAFNSENGLATQALRFVMDHRAITTAVVGIRTKSQLMDALKAVSSLITVEESRFLDGVSPNNYYSQHR